MRAQAATDVTALSLFGGEISADRVRARSRATAASGQATGDTRGSTIGNLVVLGQPVAAALNARVPLADWGTSFLLTSATSKTFRGKERAYRARVTVMDLRLTADHGGLPAGTQILVGVAETSVRLTVSSSPPAASPPSAPASAAGPGRRSASGSAAVGPSRRAPGRPPGERPAARTRGRSDLPSPNARSSAARFVARRRPR